jgi:UDP-glucose 4-epimerase
MATYLVTGGAGFIGSHLVDALVLSGHNVRVLDNLATGRLSNLQHLKNDFEYVAGDLNDTAILQQVLKNVSIVFHQAALASVPRSIASPLDTHAACATGTLRLFQEAQQAGVQRIVYASSSSVYGDQPHAIKCESNLPAPRSPYAAAKLATEAYALAFFHAYNLETVGLRYFNVFGPRQSPQGPYAAVIPLFIQALRQHKQPLIYGDGLQTRDFTYIQNVVQANLLAATAEKVAGEVFNIASGESISLLALLNELSQLCHCSTEPIFAPSRTGDVKHSHASIEKAFTKLGYTPSVSLKEGLKRTYEASLL